MFSVPLAGTELTCRNNDCFQTGLSNAVMLKNKSLRVRLHATPIYCQQPGASKQEVGVEFQMAFPLQA